eukprot:gb/GECH01003912.1/.p1 GENE.gb/GECH01003912.1/~~gb/GECH01003912.1/.p1  ORF type:complete len:240 (+),score=68.69 gb/GECH01003912.1/:1-720(+)
MRVAIYGGRGALGQSLVSNLGKREATTINIDLHKNESASHNIVVSDSMNVKEQSSLLQQQSTLVESQVKETLGDQKLDAVLCVAGGWAGGNAASSKYIPNSEAMWESSVNTSLIASQVAAKHLKDDGLLVLTGAVPSLGPTPGMIGYGLAKAAVHHLTKSLAAEGSGMPESSVTTAILPVTLDTPMNRKGMPKADFSNWTSLDEVSEKLISWTQGESRPSNGSLVKLETKQGKTEWSEV